MSNEPLSPEELKQMYAANDFGSHPHEKILRDAVYSFNVLKSAPGLGEESLGVYPKIYERLGELGYAPAYYQLGLLHYNGEWWLEKNLEKSVAFHKKAAELGDADAMFELYVLYSTGDGVEKDNDVAMEWCIKAAEMGQSRACYNMGASYALGNNGLPEDIALSLQWYEKASQAGNGRATTTLGVMYYNGDGVEEDQEKAEEYFQLAEEQGFNVDRFLDLVGIERDGGDGGMPW